MESNNKYDEYALIVVGAGLVGLAIGLLVGGLTVLAEQDEEWARHATEQCHPYALYEAKLEDFSWMCANESQAMADWHIKKVLDTPTESR